MKLFIAYQNNKFIDNSIQNKIDGLEILSGTHAGVLYKLQQQHNINAYIFNLNNLNQETLQFIYDYSRKIKIFIYHEDVNIQIVQELKNCYHLVHNELLLDNTIVIPNLVNTSIFYNKNLKNKIDNHILCFIDSSYHNNKELYQILYPNDNNAYNIKIYGSHTFKHPQNLGAVSESDKANLLNQYKKYLTVNNSYSQEALLCGCDIYTLDSLIINSTINHNISTTYQTYASFLTTILT